MSHFGIHTFAFMSEWQPKAANPILAQLKDYGIGTIEIPLLRPDDIDIAETLAVAGAHDMTLTCSLGLPATFDVVERPDEAVAFLENALDVAEGLGASCLSGVTYGTIGKTSGQPPTEKEKDAVVRVVERGGKAARKRGLKLGVEPCNRYETHLMNTAADGVAFIERSGADNVFIHLDTYHMNIEEAGMADGFRAAGDFLGYVHLSESNRGVPGTGTVDWDDTVCGLAAVYFEGPVVLESFNHMHPDIAGGLAVWKPVAARAQDVVETGLPFLKDAAARNGYRL